jgi:hypothetical protein
MDEATEVLASDDLSSPVFVDASGRRGKRIRIVFGVLGAATLVYGALVATSLAGGPLKPQQLLPFPELVNNLPVDDRPPAAQPGGKNTPNAKAPVVITAKKIHTSSPANNGPVPAPTGAPAPVVPGPGTTTTTAPPAEATDAPATPTPTATAQATPTPTTGSTPAPTPTPTPTPHISEAGTALPGAGAETSAAAHTPGTVPIGETSTGLPAATPMVSSNTGGGGSGGAGAGSGGAGATPSATASLGSA